MSVVWRHASSYVWLTLLIYCILTFVLFSLVHFVCFLSPVKCHSWFYTIIPCILVSILGRLMIPTQYMLFHTKPYLCFFCFTFMECNECTNDFNSSSSLVSIHHIRFQNERFILARLGFSRSWDDVPRFQT